MIIVNGPQEQGLVDDTDGFLGADTTAEMRLYFQQRIKARIRDGYIQTERYTTAMLAFVTTDIDRPFTIKESSGPREKSFRRFHHSLQNKGAPIPAGQQRADRAAEVTGMGA